MTTPRFKVYHPSKPANYLIVEGVLTLEDALQKAKSQLTSPWIRDYILDPSKNREYEFLKKTKNSYDEEIARLEKEIQGLKNKVIEIQ